MADIGYIALLLAFAVSIYSVIAFVFGTRRGYPELVASARNGVIVVLGLVSLAALMLLAALLSHDFSLEYVASYTSRDMHWLYILSAFWAGNAGSLLFWGWLLSICGAVVLFQNRRNSRALVNYALSVVMVTEALFLILMVFLSNPFKNLPFVPPDGMGLNPLLENPAMVIHPPALLAGYVGFTIPFAFAVGALLSGSLSNDWTRGVRRWTLIAWLLLGAGNIIGAWWAYVELGWGGYWAWDPVENAGLMPFLVGTAFLHSSMLQRRRGMLKVWNMVLIIIAFNLTIFGTFLTRSGILSVHTFPDIGMGPFFLSFIGIALLGSLGLLFYRWEKLKAESEIDSLVSKESAYLINNFLFVGAAVVVFVGTIFPSLSEAARGVKVTVGASFFNHAVGPIFLAVMFLMGICPLIAWRRASIGNLVRNFLYPLVIAVIVGIVLFFLGVRQWYALAAFFLCMFVISATLSDWGRGVRARHRMRAENYVKSFFGLIWSNRPRYGGYIVHISILFIALGVAGSSFYSIEKEAALMPGETMTIGNYTLKYEGMTESSTASKLIATATLSAYNGGKFIGAMTPEKYFHQSYEQPVTEVAIRSTPVEDLYVILGGWSEDGSATFKVLVNPLVIWIWVGGALLLLGGVIALSPRAREQK